MEPGHWTDGPAQPPIGFPPQPVYMWVPPRHGKKWDRHCGRYNACGVPVYFVRDDWYEQNVRHAGHARRGGRGHEPASRHRPGHGKGNE